ncbi:hypothetical protein N9J21_01610 [bacterium]|nr:hypothetical protein [bacterium]
MNTIRKNKVFIEKNSSLLILTNRKKINLPLGDYLRILAFVPNLGFKKIYFVGDKDLLLLSKEHSFITSIKYSNKKMISFLKKNSFIIDIEKSGKNSNKVFYIKSLLNKKNNYKQNMADILKNLSKYFKLKKYKLFTSEPKKQKNYQDIYFSWQAPTNWKIKEYPQIKLHRLNFRLKEELGLKTKFQKKNESIKSYIRNIKHSQIIVSIVNLGCHIANLFDKKLVMLSGPNYHEDSRLNEKQITIFPTKFCDLHKKVFKHKKLRNRVGTLPKNTNKCQCMNNINENEIFKQIKKLLNGKI